MIGSLSGLRTLVSWTGKAPEATLPSGRRVMPALALAAGCLAAVPGVGHADVRYDLTTAQVQQQILNTVTADQLAPGAPRYTARGVDPQQSSKQYQSDPMAPIPDGKMFWQCMTLTPDGVCHSGRPNEIRHVLLSCLYRNEVDGKLYRVLQRSTYDMTTPLMQRMVCGGHRLVYDSSSLTYMPVQTDAQGRSLYLNPDHVVHAEPVTAP
ncbi:MAG: hypothetical protein ACYCW6_17620 [Candidatus Xenobia bacterium]